MHHNIEIVYVIKLITSYFNNLNFNVVKILVKRLAQLINKKYLPTNLELTFNNYKTYTKRLRQIQ